MGTLLQRGGNLSLSKDQPNLEKIVVGLGWDSGELPGEDFDLDALTFLLDDTGKVRSNDDFVFFNNRKSSEGAVEHLKDNRTGAGEGDDEIIRIDLTKVPTDVQKIVFAVSVYEAEMRRQNFGMITSAFIRILNNVTHSEITKYDLISPTFHRILNNVRQNEIIRYELSADARQDTAVILGELYRHGHEWKFGAVGQGFAGGFAVLVASYGVEAD